MNLSSFFGSLFDRFSRTQTSTLASSLAFYSALSLAPLLILFITISSKFSSDLQQKFITEVRTVVGGDAAQTFSLIIENAKERPDLATMSGLFGGLTLLLSASLFFGELKSAMNQIFECPPETAPQGSTAQKILDFLKSKILHVGLALASIALMIASLVASSFLSAAFGSENPFWPTLNMVVSFFFYIGLFSILFRYLPDVRQSWRQALSGGTITALLFVAGKELIAVYLGRSAIGSAYGAAGTIVVLLVWIYYSTMITFIGAHISRQVTFGRRFRHGFPQGSPAGTR